MSSFERLANEANWHVYLGAPTLLRRQSSLVPIYTLLKRAATASRDLEQPAIDEILRLIGRIPAAEQQKYSKVIKLVEKQLRGESSKIFESLKRCPAEKLSKSQQRYTIPVAADPETELSTAVCGQMALYWLQEQWRDVPQAASRFPRLDGGNVVGSEAAISLTRDAIRLGKEHSLNGSGPSDMIRRQMGQLGLPFALYDRGPANPSFDTFESFYKARPLPTKGFLVDFLVNGHYSHAVAMFRKGADCHFYDANAGSYRIAQDNLTRFLREYNDVCLPKKWPSYRAPASRAFTRLYILRAPTSGAA